MARAGSCGGDAAGAGRPEPWELSLEEVLKAYEQPLNEEQAWAVCFQGCRGLRGSPGRRLRDTGDLLLRGDGSVGAREPEAAEPATMVVPLASSEAQVLLKKFQILLDVYGPVLHLPFSYLPWTNEHVWSQMLQKLREDEPQVETPRAELDSLGHTDWARLWVQLMRELRHGVKLKKVQEQEFNPLPTEFQLTPFEMLMQDIRARNYKLRKVMVDGDIPPRVKKDAHELILDFIRSRPPLKQVSERRLRPLPPKQRSLHEKILEEIKQERRLRPVRGEGWAARGFGSLPCILNACSGDAKSTSCINLSVTDAGSSTQRPRPRVLLKAPTLAEMEEMNTSEEEESPCGEVTLKRDRSFSEHDLAQLRSEVASGLQSATQPPGGIEPPRPRAGSAHAWRPGSRDQGTCPASVSDPSHPLLSNRGSSGDRPEASTTPDAKHLWLEFSHPVESLALTVEEVMDVRRVLVKAEMEKFLQNKELFSSLKKGKICCCCRTKFPLFSWPPTCLFCKRAVCTSCSIKVKMPSKKFGHIPVYTLGFESPQRVSAAKTAPIQRRDIFQSLQGPQWQSVEEVFPHIYSHGCVLKDVCSECTGFVADVVRSSRKSVDVLNTTPRRSRQTQSLYIPNTRTLDFK
ncbi:protein spire homolog 2 [Hylobates moloch]|uniref:protein spire homolog 2 n=1 Tax=Hylobates moloch TaxID=81572 RepID=UPI0026746283|nr:protein spire homolog 2 [Hylobates moloch]